MRVGRGDVGRNGEEVQIVGWVWEYPEKVDDPESFSGFCQQNACLVKYCIQII